MSRLEMFDMLRVELSDALRLHACTLAEIMHTVKGASILQVLTRKGSPFPISCAYYLITDIDQNKSALLIKN